MGCTASTHTTAQDPIRPSSKPEECNGASTTGAGPEKAVNETEITPIPEAACTSSEPLLNAEPAAVTASQPVAEAPAAAVEGSAAEAPAADSPAPEAPAAEAPAADTAPETQDEAPASAESQAEPASTESQAAPAQLEDTPAPSEES